MSYSQQPHGLQPTRLLCPWDFPGKSTGVGCHCLLRHCSLHVHKCHRSTVSINFEVANKFWVSKFVNMKSANNGDELHFLPLLAQHLFVLFPSGAEWTLKVSTQLHVQSQCPVGLASVTGPEHSTWPEHSQSEPSPGTFLPEVGGKSLGFGGKTWKNVTLGCCWPCSFLCWLPVVGKHITEVGSVRERDQELSSLIFLYLVPQVPRILQQTLFLASYNEECILTLTGGSTPAGPHPP